MKPLKKVAIFAFAVWGLFALPYGYAILSAAKVGNTGNLQAVGVTTDINSINWGIITPGQTKTQLVIVTNTGNQPVTLTMETSNWNPALASSCLTLTWDYDAETILPQQSQTVQFSLTVSTDPDPSITTFSFDITLTGIQA